MDIRNLDSELFDLISAASGRVYLYVADLRTDCFHWAKEAVEYFGLPGEYTENSSPMWLELIHPEDRPAFQEDFHRLLDGVSDHHYCEYRIRNAAGDYVWVECRGTVQRDENGAASMFAGFITNLGIMAKVDVLTGLLNAQEGMTQLERYIEEGQSGAVLLFGLDNFTRINDLYGFEAGDQILRLAAREIQELHCGMPFRMDGDKVMCLVPNCTRDIAEYIFSEVQDIFVNVPRTVGMLCSLSVSCGAVLFPSDDASPGELRARAEHALEIAKRNHPGTLARYSSELHQQAVKSFELQEMLRKAIENNCEGFFLNYQPLIRNDGQSVFGAEALLRFSCPELDMPFVSPGEFIPVLEKNGMINDVGAWVIRTALKQAAEWRKIIPDFCVSVNVSYSQMVQSNFKEIVLEALKESGVPADGLILELTESCRYLELEQLRDVFSFFAAQGIKMALDDFGTGYASVDTLRTLTPPWIKIDHTFVASIGKNHMDEAIIEYLLQLCHRTNINVCVEGIENQEILSIVQKYRPQLLQGYYFSKPLSIEAFADTYVGKGA